MSTGNPSATAAAGSVSTAPEPNRLMISLSVMAATIMQAIDTTIARWFGNPTPPYLDTTAALCRRLLSEVNAEGYARTYGLFASSDRAHEGRLGALTCPTLFMTGEFDPNSTPDMSLAMASAIPGSQCHVLAGERHMMTLTSAPQVHAELHPFLQAAEARHNDLEAA